MLKTGPCCCFFCFFGNLILPAERRGFFKKKNKETKKNPFLALKTGPVLLRNILGPVFFHASLDQFLTLGFLCFSFLFLAETPILYCFQQTMQNLKKHK